MKKTVLFFIAVFSGFAVMAGGTVMYNETTGVISLQYSENGNDRDGDNISDEWRGSDRGVLTTAVFNVMAEDWGSPTIGESFMVTIKGTADFTGTVKLYIADEREEVGGFSKLSKSNGKFQVTKGKAFAYTTVMNITDNSSNGVELTDGRLVIVFEPEKTSSVEFNPAAPMTITTTEFTVLWEPSVDVESPTILTYKNNVQEGALYESRENINLVTKPEFANIKITGTSASNIESLEYALFGDDGYVIWDHEFLSNIKPGDIIDESFSILVSYEPEGTEYQNILQAIGLESEFCMNIYI